MTLWVAWTLVLISIIQSLEKGDLAILEGQDVSFDYKNNSIYDRIKKNKLLRKDFNQKENGA